METKHTRGPWYVRIGPPNGIAVHWSEDGQICPMRWTDGMRPEVEARVAADAALIAAAPDLLNALKEMADDLVERWDMNSPSTNPGIKHCVEQAHKAIAKAEGR